MSNKYPHVNAANKYARDVVSGKIDACELLRAQCRRHLNDLEDSKKKGSKFEFKKPEAEKVCLFAEMLPHVKGPWHRKRELIVLQPWQKFFLCVVFGWWLKGTDKRRYSEVYAKIPRKNGKSVIAAIIALYMFTEDNDGLGAEIYVGASNEKQAGEVFKPAKAMVQKTPELADCYGVEVCAKNMNILADGSKFEMLVGTPGDGGSPSCAVMDEVHEWANSSLYDTMVSGMGARAFDPGGPLALMITTSGFDLSSFCYEKEREAIDNILDVARNDEQFVLIYTTDKGDDWKSPDVLRKCNPNIAVSVSEEYLLQQQQKAIINTKDQARFKTKHLNQWVSAKDSWLNIVEWKECENKALSLEDFEGCDCVIAVDLAKKIDIASKVYVFTQIEDGREFYTVFGVHYLPESTIDDDEKGNSAYRGWAEAGYLTTHDGEELEYDLLEEDLKQDRDRFNVKEIVFDPWKATQITQRLEKDGATVVEYPNTPKNMTEAMNELEASIKSLRIQHDGNPVLNWMAGNVVVKNYIDDMIKPHKEVPKNKIDGMVALIMGIGRAMAEDQIQDSIYNQGAL